jgi:thiol:disulfide interchange protein DsbD
MKAIGLAAGAGKRRGAVLVEAGAYAAGVIATFLALAGLLLVLRGAGEAVGWGFQFQSPVFVAATCWLIFAIGLNMSGVFAIGGGALAGLGAGLGAGAASRGGPAGSFMTGLLAVLVATPCTAPFMGAAIAGALAAPLWVGALGFLAMGVGFALPYVALAATPGFARRLPRPGAWMDVLRQGLAFPMYATAVWLLWVVAIQAGAEGVLTTAGGLVLIGFAVWALRLVRAAGRVGRRVAAGGALLAGLGAVALLASLARAPEVAAPEGLAGDAFTPARLAGLRGAGTPVFVNMTAAWCVTCIVNEQVALSSPAVRDAFARAGITYLKGDWTRRDPAITEYLRALGRDGVPLYVLYPPRGGAAVVLPQILTEQRVLDELARAGL